jgi:predicted transcriptional regulator
MTFKNGVKILEQNKSFEINEELAGVVPMALPDDQLALNHDIAVNGQLDPIILWRGKIVDGRCRQKACLSCNERIKYKELVDEMTEDEVKSFVKSVNTRRNLTMTQKVIVALRDYLDKKNTGKKGVSFPKIAKEWGVSANIVKNAKYISEHMPELLEPLFNGQSVSIENSSGKEIKTTKITSIYAYIRKINENATLNDIHAWDEDSYILTQEGKEWYYKQLKLCGLTDVPLQIKMNYAELANYKFHSKLNSLTGEIICQN